MTDKATSVPEHVFEAARDAYWDVKPKVGHLDALRYALEVAFQEAGLSG